MTAHNETVKDIQAMLKAYYTRMSMCKTVDERLFETKHYTKRMSNLLQSEKIALLKKIREAVANYIRTEGCGCCEGRDHDEHAAVIAKLLNVPMYSDKSGYDFQKFVTSSATQRGGESKI